MFKQPAVYDPLNWNNEEWRQYIKVCARGSGWVAQPSAVGPSRPGVTAEQQISWTGDMASGGGQRVCFSPYCAGPVPAICLSNPTP